MSIFVLAFYIALFIAIAVIDLKYYIIPNWLIYTAVPLGLILSAVAPLGLLEGKAFPGSLLMAFLGGLAGFVLLLIPALIFPSNLGMGDAKLAGLIGVINGLPGVLIALVLAFILGGIASALIIWLRKKRISACIPFGPYLCAGGLVALIWGNDIINLYRGLW